MHKEKIIDLRSDTVTKPTDEMREAMFNAVVGDDVFDDDFTTKEMQELAAEMTGKEAALFVPSGTFGNLLCIYTHANSGDEVIADDSSHIIQHEAGAGAAIAGVQFRTFESNGDDIFPYDIEKRIRVKKDIHEPVTALICLENARSDGQVLSVDTMENIREISKRYNIPVHIDGARIFNAACYLNINVSELSVYCDSMSFCLSKGLCAPIGSIVVGTHDFIEKAKRKRKQLGGGMRQTGILAAAGIVALKKMVSRLCEDNENAIYFAEKLSEIPCIDIINNCTIHINMVFLKLKNDLNVNHFIDAMKEAGIAISSYDGKIIRLVTHYWITRDDIDYAVREFKKYFLK